MKEREFQSLVVDMAHLFKWRLAHFRPAMTQAGNWITAMQGDKGFPDLVLVRGTTVLFVELKSEKGRISPEQRQWLDDLELVAAATNHVEVHVWRPGHWHNGHIERQLR